MSPGTMKQTLFATCAATALALGASQSASAAVNTICSEPNGSANAPLSYPSQPPLCLLSGGSSLAAVVYKAQALAHYGVTDPTFGINYTSIGSGAGQNLFLNDSSTFDTNNVTPSGQVITWDGSDATLSGTQITSWSTMTFGQSVSGNLIQIPTFATAIAIVYKRTTNQQSGSLQFTDTQLCGIFSGLLTSWSQITGYVITGSPLTGIIHPTYRADNSGTSFLFTQHLAAVCTNGVNSNITFTASTNFASEFGGVADVPTNFVAATNSSGVQTTIQTAGNGQNGDIGYLSPDYTQIAPVNTGFAPYPAVAQILNSNDSTYYLPNTANTQFALANVTAPAAGDANPADYVPALPNPPHYYPIVGFTTADMAQCYANATIGADLIEYWEDFYTLPYQLNLLVQHGFSALPTNLSTAVFNNLLNGPTTGNTDIEDPAVCATGQAAWNILIPGSDYTQTGTVAGR